MNKRPFEIKFYTRDEIKELIKSKEELYYVDDGVDEAIIKFEDIPDFIVDYNTNLSMRDLRFIKVGKGSLEPDIMTCGIFLDKINPDLRSRMIDRLIALQTYEIEIKDYKIIDEDIYFDVKNKLEREENNKGKKKITNKEVR